jgi:hypothetical protein
MVSPRAPELQLISPVLVPGLVADGIQAPALTAGRRFHRLGSTNTGGELAGQPGVAAEERFQV